MNEGDRLGSGSCSGLGRTQNTTARAVAAGNAESAKVMMKLLPESLKVVAAIVAPTSAPNVWDACLTPTRPKNETIHRST